MVSDFDIVISGGGMTGLVFAIALAQQSPQWSIAVLEASKPTQQRPGFDGRSLALSAGTIAELQTLGIWPHFQAFSHPITTIHVAEKNGVAAATLLATDSDLAQFGAVLELNRAGFALRDIIARYPSIMLVEGVSLRECWQQDDHVLLQLSDEQCLTCRLLVGAEGAQSTLPAQLYMPIHRYDFHQQAIISTLHSSYPVDGQAWERFTPEGPMALLPLGPQTYSLVWCRETAAARQMMDLSDAAFLAAFQHQFGYRAGRFSDIGKRANYPLSLYYVQPTVHHRVVMVGNAAHQLHPVAGQGFNLAMRDISALAACLADVSDPGAHASLRAYQQSRYNDQIQTMRLTSCLTVLFQSGISPIYQMRQTGLALVSQSRHAQQLIIRQALGYTK
jgi:2-octaprenyl-6-methoxyphenol hydroxylase